MHMRGETAYVNLQTKTIRIQHGSFSLQKTSNVFGCASLRLLATLASSVPRLSLVGSAFPDPPSLLSVCCCQALGDVTLAKFYRACEGGGAAYGLATALTSLNFISDLLCRAGLLSF